MNLCIVGSGYVGLVSAACFAEMGNFVTCVDVNPDVVAKLKRGEVHIYEPGLEAMVQRNFADGRLKFTTDLAEGLKDALFVFVCVGTPPQPDGSCDLQYVYKVAEQVGQTMTDEKIVVDKSTVPVGTADKVREIITEQLKARGEDIPFDVVSNPEFLKEGDAVSDFMKPDRVVVGTDNPKTAEAMRNLYSPFARSREKLIVMGVRSAEMTKYAANCMLATKISFINEMANICEQVGADVRDVRTGIGADHRIGYHFIYPGVGYGGSCFPKDVKALIRTSLDYGHTPQILQSVDEVNDKQKLTLANKIKGFYENQGGVAGKTLAVWGIAFKANTDDIREAPSLALIKELTAAGMKIRAFDPVAADNGRKDPVVEGNDLVEVVDDQYAALDGADGLAVVTEWNQFRNPSFKELKAKLSIPVVFDGRNLYKSDYLASEGIAHFPVGRAPTLLG